MTTLSRIPRASAAAAVLITLTLLSGCGGSSEPRSFDRSPGATTPSPKSTKVQTIRLSEHGLSFELPSGWTKIDRDGVLTPDNPMVKDLAENLGMSPDRLIQVVETSIEVFAVTDEGMDNGFLENVNVVPLPAGQATESQLKLQIAAIAGKTTATRQVTTPIGSGITIDYTLTSAGTVVHGSALAVGASTDDQVLITVSAHRASTASDRLDQILESLAELD